MEVSYVPFGSTFAFHIGDKLLSINAEGVVCVEDWRPLYSEADFDYLLISLKVYSVSVIDLLRFVEDAQKRGEI